MKPSCSGGVQERDEEMVLSHLLVFPFQASEAIPQDGDKKGPVLWQEDSKSAAIIAEQTFISPKYQMELLPLITSDGNQKAVLSRTLFSQLIFRNGALILF